MRKKYFAFMVLALGLGIAGINAQIPEKTGTNIARAAQEDFRIDDKGVLQRYNGTETKVVIPEGVTGIGDNAFARYTDITEVTIPDTVTSIAEGAFVCCDSLKSITIPAGVTTIGYNSFSMCPSLEEIIVKEGNPRYESRAGVLFEKTESGLKLDRYPENKKDTAYVIPNEVVDIKEWAFEQCVNLSSVTIPSGVTEIKMGTFDSTGLTEITIPSNITSIGTRAFGYCEKLEKVSIPDSVASMGREVFTSCKSLTSITLPKDIKRIEDATFFNCTSLAAITFPAGLERIEDLAFANNKSLTSIVIPDSVTNMDRHVFWGCENLTDITLSGSLRSIQSGAFADCSSLRSITIPNSVKEIKDKVFDNCGSLVKITIPKNVRTIEDNIFSGCHALERITVEKGSKKYKDIDGVLFGKSSSGLNLMAYPANKKETVYTIPKKVTSVGARAFYDCSRIKEIIIPNGVKSIGENALMGCSNLTDLTIPSGMKEIQYISHSFWGCGSLKNLNISVAKGEKIDVMLILSSDDERKPTITSKKKEVATISKPHYKTDGANRISAKVTIAAENKGKTKVIFQKRGSKNKKIKSVLTITVQ